MGFETKIKKEIQKYLVICLKIPYGIWNQDTLMDILKLKIVWRFPMGFETIESFRLSNQQRSLKIPYGIWN